MHNYLFDTCHTYELAYNVAVDSDSLSLE